MRILKIVVATLFVLQVAFTGYRSAVSYLKFAPIVMDNAARQVASEFYRRTFRHDYTGSHQMLSLRLQSQISTQNLTQQWNAYEQKHGPIKFWGNAPGNNVSLWPRYVVLNHRIGDGKHHYGLVTTHLVPEGANWRIDQLTITP